MSDLLVGIAALALGAGAAGICFRIAYLNGKPRR
jgi:hypothetical protein